MNAQLKRILPEPVKRAVRPCYQYSRDLKYDRNLRRLQTKKSRLLILATIANSGTHYMKFLLANYVNLAAGGSERPISANEMNAMLPNIWHKAYWDPAEYKRPTNLLSLLGLDDIPRSHFEYQYRYWRQSRTLHLFRNPLDYAVSQFFYKYEFREGLSGTVSGPAEVLETHFDDYTRFYRSYREAAETGNHRILRISYEDLIRTPQACLRIIIKWLGVEPDPALVETATLFSSKDVVAQLEKDGPIHPDRADLKGSFVRDGSIGQWKKYFDKSDLA
jgi:hypothetical protein